VRVGLSYVVVATTAPLGPVNVNVDELMLVGSRSRENVTSTPLPRATAVAPAAGARDVIVGAGGGAGLVVNDQETGLARATPSTAVRVVAMCAVYGVENASAEFGVSVTVRVLSL
jgi:hypothetical protein